MGRLVLYGVGGIVAVAVALKLLATILAMIFALGTFVLFKVIPLVLIGWLVMKVWRSWKERPAS
jgi:hypothetical protein